MREKEKDKSFVELADEALDHVAGGKSVILQECVVCGKSYYKIGPDGKPYCYEHYAEKYGK